jgi:hypothetical protein
MLLGTKYHDDFTLSNIQQLVELFLPMQLGGNKTFEIFDESLEQLWCQLRSCLELSALSNTVNAVEKMSLLFIMVMGCFAATTK